MANLATNLSKLPTADLIYYGEFVEYMLIRCDAADLPYWEGAAEAYNIETLGRQAAALLKRLPYGLTRA